MAETVYLTIRTLGELKAAIKKADAVYVWANWEGDDGSYIPVAKSKFLFAIGADTPAETNDDGALNGHGGRPDWTPVKAEMRDNEVYIA